MTNRQLQEMRQHRQRKVAILETISRHYHLAACALNKKNAALYKKEKKQITNLEIKRHEERISLLVLKSRYRPTTMPLL